MKNMFIHLSSNTKVADLKQHVLLRVVSRAGIRAEFGLEFVKIFQADFGPAYTSFFNDFFLFQLHLFCSLR